MLLYSSCSCGGNNAHSSTRRKRTEKNSLHIEKWRPAHNAVYWFNVRLAQNERQSILYDSTQADLGDQLQDTTEPKTIRTMRTPTEHGEARCVICRNCCRNSLNISKMKECLHHGTHPQALLMIQIQNVLHLIVWTVYEMAMWAGAWHPLPFLGCHYPSFSLCCRKKKKTPILCVCARHVHGDPDSFVPARLGTLDRQCDGL